MVPAAAPLPADFALNVPTRASVFASYASGSVPVVSICTISVFFKPISTGYVWATLNVTGPRLNHTATVGTGT